MQVKITKPDSTLFDGEASLLQLPGVDGQFEILQNHAPIIAALDKGSIRVVPVGAESISFNIRGGVLKGQKNNILILVQ